MKTIPKRTDLFSNLIDSNVNIEKQMSELLQIRNLLNSKLSVLSKSMGEDVLKFTMKNYPREIKNINSLNFQKNLFGTDRTFCQFSIDFKALLVKIQAEVRGVLQVMQKFSFTRNIAGFINSGIMECFLKINDFMLSRQEFCTKLIERIQQNVLNGKTIFSKNFDSNNICVKCNQNLQREKVIATKEAMLLGGLKVRNFYRRQLQPASQQDDDPNEEIDFYSKITKARKKAKIIDGTDPHDIKSEEDIKHNLERLQNNLEKRKYDILSCLVEMGQFGSSLIKSSDVIEKTLNENSLPQEFQKIASLLPTIRNIPPKFNFKEFTFDIGKHFYKEIRDIENQLLGIKTKYKSLLSNHYQQFLSTQVQCDIAKDEYEKQMQRYEKRIQRQIKSLTDRIAEIENLNKEYKSKINEYENSLKSHIFSKLEEDNNRESGRISIQKSMQKLVNRYEKKILEQQKELESYRSSTLNSQNCLGAAPKLNQKCPEKSSTEQTHQEKLLEYVSKIVNDKENFSQNIDETQKVDVRKRISLLLQPIINKMPENHESQNKNSMNYLNSLDSNQNEKILSFEQITKFVPIKSMNNANLSRNRRQSTLLVEKSKGSLEITSNVFQIQVNHSRFSLIEFALRRSNTRPFQRKQSQALIPRQIEILSDKQSTKMLSYLNEKDVIPQVKQSRSPKLTKVKSQQSAKNDKIEYVYDGKQFIKQGKTIECQTNPTKRFVSQHSDNIVEKKVVSPLTKNPKEKLNKKAAKTLSLAVMKKGQQDQSKNSLKLPSLSSYQKLTQKVDKIKSLQKASQINNKAANLLMKKKRKKRNFSQENLGIQTVFNNHCMTMSLGSNLQKNAKQKKEYIIDFIPKIQDSNISKFKQDQKQIIESQIQTLFDLKQLKKNELQTKKTNKKGKYYAKAVLTKGSDEYFSEKLKKQEIQLSTKIYSLMATIKSINSKVYQLIRGKMKKQFDQRHDIKSNCDQISMTVDLGNRSAGHLPLSLSFNHAEIEQFENAFNNDKNKNSIQNMSTANSNGREENKNVNRLSDHINEQIDSKHDQSQLSKIINYLIVKHRNLCQNTTSEEVKNSNLRTCEHLMNFYQSLLKLAEKIPSHSSTVERK